MPSARRRTHTTPPGYPITYETSVRLADGRKATIRPILPSDAPELVEAISTADPDTLYARFLGGAPPLTEPILDELTKLDYVSRFALVARSGRHGVGIARYAALPPSDDGSVTADVAVAVAPRWRRIGLATALVQLLARRALECGITDFSALFLANNRPVTALAHASHARVVMAEGRAQLDTPLRTQNQDLPSHDRFREQRQ